MTSNKRLLRINGQSAEADRLDEAEKLRNAAKPPKPAAFRTITDDLLDEARADDERERMRQHDAAVERQYQHIMAKGGKAARAQWAMFDDSGAPVTSHVSYARELSTKAVRPYFAYGMNMNVDQMRKRCPDAKPVGAYVLKGYKLVFRHFADIVEAKGEKVSGVVWLISEKCEAALDRLEGFPRHYVKGNFSADVNGKRRQVMFYRMATKRSQMPPSEHYLRCILSGYASFKLNNAPLIAAAQAAYDANPPMQSRRDGADPEGAPFVDEGNDEEFF